MTSVNSRAGWLATSDDGHWVAWSEQTRLILVDATTWTFAGEILLDLEPPTTLAMSADRLLVVQTRGSTTRVRVLSIPDLKPLAEGSLDTAARLAAVIGPNAVLLAGPDTMTALDLAELNTTKITVRGPIEIVAPFSNQQVLVAARGKLEAWNLEERRPTHRLGLTLPKNPKFAGLAAGETLLWAVSGNAPGTATAYRLSDGTQLGESVLGGAPRVVLPVAASPTLIALVQPEGGAVELVAVDLLTHVRRVLPFAAPIIAVGVAGDTVVVLPETGIPMLVPISGGPARPILTVASGVASESPRAEVVVEAPVVAASSVVVNRLDEWRAQVQAAITVTTTPVGKEPAIRVLGEEPRSRSRAELCAWGETVRNRRSTAPPPPPHVWNLTELAHRFGIDLRSRALIALLYAAWLEGDGRDGIPVAQVARALGNDELGWIEALAQGRVGRLGWIRAKLGRTRLHPQVGRFLDEAPPRVKLVVPEVDSVKSLVPPTAPSRWRSPNQDFAALASACGTALAIVDLDALPPHRFEDVLDDRVLEARLHGALPVLTGEGGAMLDAARLEGALLFASRAMPTLPLWPPEA